MISEKMYNMIDKANMPYIIYQSKCLSHTIHEYLSVVHDRFTTIVLLGNNFDVKKLQDIIGNLYISSTINNSTRYPIIDNNYFLNIKESRTEKGQYVAEIIDDNGNITLTEKYNVKLLLSINDVIRKLTYDYQHTNNTTTHDSMKKNKTVFGKVPESFKPVYNDNVPKIIDEKETLENKNIDVELLKKQIDELKRQQEMKSVQLKDMQTAYDSDIRNFTEYFDDLNDSKRFLRMDKERYQEKLDKYQYDKNIYFDIQEDILDEDNSMEEHKIAPFFSHDFEVFKFMDENGLFCEDIEKEYETFTDLVKNVKPEPELIDIDAFINKHNEKQYPSYEDMKNAISDDSSEEMLSTINKTFDENSYSNCDDTNSFSDNDVLFEDKYYRSETESTEDAENNFTVENEEDDESMSTNSSESLIDKLTNAINS